MVDQYKILWDLLEAELKRFWFGYHILSILKIASISGVIGFLKLENSNLDINFVWVGILFFIILLSALNILLNYRAQLIYQIILRSINEIEKKDENLCITIIISEISGGKISENTPDAMNIANVLPIVILNVSLICGYFMFLKNL